MALRKWQVHRCDQKIARDGSDPAQTTDPIKTNRFYVVISPDAHLAGGGKVTCVPLGEKSWSGMLEVPLREGEGGATKDCFIWCNHIFTIPHGSFDETPIGIVPLPLRSQIEAAIKDYLDLY